MLVELLEVLHIGEGADCAEASFGLWRNERDGGTRELGGEDAAGLSAIP